MLIAEMVLRVFGATGKPAAYSEYGQSEWKFASRSKQRARQSALSGPPFVLVAHDLEGQWDVYANHFDAPLASFTQRQPACNYASKLAQAREDCLVLLRESLHPTLGGAA
jgi:hypothetical protein